MSINDGDAGHVNGCGRVRAAGAEQPGDGGDVAVDFTALACSCVSSVVFWSDARRGSTFHVLDRGCAALYVECVALVSVRGGGERQVRFELQVLLGTAMFGLFAAGDVFFKRRRYDHQLAFHLLFR
jgi:hypothetical protein